MPAAVDDLGRRYHLGRHRGPLSGAAGRIRTGGRRHLCRRIARRIGLEKVVSFDMGGTTAKICLIEDRRPQTARLSRSRGPTASEG